MASERKASRDHTSAKKRKRDKAEETPPAKMKKRRSKTEVDAHDGSERPRHSIARTNGSNNHGEPEMETNDVAESSLLPVRSRSTALRESHHDDEDQSSAWTMQAPMGGRMLDIDPIFSQDEKYLILSYDSSIQVYSTADSLLVRRINLPISSLSHERASKEPYIVAVVPSKALTDYIWVACSDGRIWRLNWTSGTGADECFHAKSSRVIDMAIDSIQIGTEDQDLLVTSEKLGKSDRQLVAYDLDALRQGTAVVLYSGKTGILLVRCANEGRNLACVTKNGLLLGTARSTKSTIASISDLQYNFLSFDVDDRICCLDIRISNTERRQKQKKKMFSMDLVVGNSRGKVLLYEDVLAAFPDGEGTAKRGNRQSLQHRVYHWHRRAVHSVKWSKDGNYLISGGSEQTLVLWQLDTGRRDTLPHLSATVENIVVSPGGSNYALHLDDNSTMIISTAEMKPTAYVSGLQSFVSRTTISKDFLAPRVGQLKESVLSPVVGSLSPLHPSHLLLCCGNGEQAATATGVPSTPSLQTFDLESFRSISKQAIARSNPAESNTTSAGFPIGEPRVTHMMFSNDGLWLATVDDWQPPRKDFEAISNETLEAMELVSERREILLKFWAVGEADGSLKLVSRVSQPHFTEKPEAVFDLAANPAVAQFATLGNDGMVRIWGSHRSQKARGLDEQVLAHWKCGQVMHVGQRPGTEAANMVTVLNRAATKSGALAYSEDGSCLFAAFEGLQETVLYVLDPDSGEVRTTIRDVFTGRIGSIKVLGSTLILLSDTLKVYDIVQDQLLYGVQLCPLPEDWLQLRQIAVDQRSTTFAIATPWLGSEQGAKNTTAGSELAIFSRLKAEPLLVKRLPRAITCLLPASSASGYVAIDSAAQAWSIQHASDASSLARPLAELGLDADGPADDTATNGALALLADDEVMSEDDGGDDARSDEDEQDDEADVHAAVIAPQRLREIFDAGPAFALPPVEDIFYQVTSLLSA